MGTTSLLSKWCITTAPTLHVTLHFCTCTGTHLANDKKKKEDFLNRGLQNLCYCHYQGLAVSVYVTTMYLIYKDHLVDVEITS